MSVFNNKNSRKGSKILRLPLHTYLSYLLLATFVFTGVSFSKYSTAAVARDSGRVAAFSVGIQGEKEDVSLVLNKEKTSATYSFTVTSNSEVRVYDRVTVKLPQALPAGVTMTATVNGSHSEPVSTDNGYVFVDSFGYGNQAHNWVLTFTADPDVVDITEDLSLNGITVYVEAAQLD